MVQVAIAGNSAFELCTLEVDRPKPSYSVDTLATLREEHPESELFFLLGLDALEDLPNWHEPERLIQLATLAVAPRGGQPAAGGEAPERVLPGLGKRIVWVEMPRVDISATELRRRASEGRSLRYLVPDAVEAYIRERALYRREPE
jgi:nicotinate-nucleotide adenylyltransferase